MTLWLLRAGKYGEREEFALERNVVAIGWQELSDLSPIKSREQLAALLRETYLDEKENTLLNWTRQLWDCLHNIQIGDLVAMPSKRRAVIHVGEVTSEYRFEQDFPVERRHVRSVKWLGELPRDQFDKDILYSLSAPPTINRVSADKAEERVRALLKGKGDGILLPRGEGSIPGDVVPPDIEELARDQIRSYINSKYKGHGLARLVGALLQAQGYIVRVSPEGPDGGIDIIAGKGALGFEPPRLVVQVKSGDAPVDVNVIRELKGVMSTFSAEQGLFVAWGGYKTSVDKETAREYFKIRLWDSDELIKQLQDNYDRLPDDVQAELPLKRIWILVQEDEA